MNHTTPQAVSVLRAALEHAIKQNECEMMLTGDEIRQARKALEQTERAAIAGEAKPVAEVKATFEGKQWIHWQGKPEIGMKLYTHPAAIQPAGDAAGWVDEFGNVFPLGARSVNGKLSHSAAYKYGWKPLYAAPAPYETEAVQAAPELTVWEGSLPESNGKSNFTALLIRKGASLMDTNSLTISRSEYPDRVRYEADCVRFLIGELATDPCVLDYDTDKHSGYLAPAVQAAPEVKASELPSIAGDAEFDSLFASCVNHYSFRAKTDLIAHIDTVLRAASSPVAAPQPDLVGMEVSMDVSTGDEDGTNRIFGRVEGVQAGTDKNTTIILAVEESRNFAAPESAEPSADAERLTFVMERSAWIAWSKDGESCRLFHRDDDGEAIPMLGWGARHWSHDPREAIDAARLATSSAAKGEA